MESNLFAHDVWLPILPAILLRLDEDAKAYRKNAENSISTIRQELLQIHQPSRQCQQQQ